MIGLCGLTGAGLGLSSGLLKIFFASEILLRWYSSSSSVNMGVLTSGVGAGAAGTGLVMNGLVATGGTAFGVRVFSWGGWGLSWGTYMNYYRLHLLLSVKISCDFEIMFNAVVYHNIDLLFNWQHRLNKNFHQLIFL